MMIKDEIFARYELLTKTTDALRKRIEELPEGRIVFKRNKKSIQYFWVKDNTNLYLSKKDSQKIKELAQKLYLKKALKAAKQEECALSKVLKIYPGTTLEEVYDTLPEEAKTYVNQIVTDDETYINKWLNAPYHLKPFSENDPEFYTLNGERVRSKSEVIIADRLRANGIPYKYECPLKIGKEIIHPDFTILRMSDRKILYHEHCGKMGDSGYTKKLVKRVNLYSEAKIIQGDNLFLTFETDDIPLDIRALDEFIKQNYR